MALDLNPTPPREVTVRPVVNRVPFQQRQRTGLKYRAKAGGGAAVGAIIDALAGGGTGAAIGAASGGALGLGANAITSGGQIELKPETLLRFQTAALLATTVYEKNGVQIQLPAAPGPALKVRATNE